MPVWCLGSAGLRVSVLGQVLVIWLISVAERVREIFFFGQQAQCGNYEPLHSRGSTDFTEARRVTHTRSLLGLPMVSCLYKATMSNGRWITT